MKELLSNQEPTLYILCGVAFSGKSTLANKLTERMDMEKVGIDVIRERRGLRWEENEKVTPEDWKSIMQEAYDDTFELLSSGKNVIFDSTNHDRESRNRLRALAAKGNFPTKVIYIDVPTDVARSRWLRNKSEMQRSDLPEHLFQHAIDNLEKPTEDENVISFSPTEDFDKWMEANFLGNT